MKKLAISLLVFSILNIIMQLVLIIFSIIMAIDMMHSNETNIILNSMIFQQNIIICAIPCAILSLITVILSLILGIKLLENPLYKTQGILILVGVFVFPILNFVATILYLVKLDKQNKYETLIQNQVDQEK